MSRGVAPAGLQSVRRAARQPRRDDARHLRQHPHQERDAGRQGGRADQALARRRRDVDLRRGHGVQEGAACRWSSSAARSTAPAPRATGRPRAPICWASRRCWPRASSASTARTWSAWACCRWCSRTGMDRKSVGLDGSETIDILGLEAGLRPRMDLTCRITRSDGTVTEIPVLCRVDTLGRGRLLQARRHPAVCAAQPAEGCGRRPARRDLAAASAGWPGRAAEALTLR